MALPGVSGSFFPNDFFQQPVISTKRLSASVSDVQDLLIGPANNEEARAARAVNAQTEASVHANTNQYFQAMVMQNYGLGNLVSSTS